MLNVLSVAEGTPTTGVIRMDPFEVPELDKPLEGHVQFPTVRYPSLEPSQTTAILKQFLGGGNNESLIPTQHLGRFTCECGCKEKFGGYALNSVQCSACGARVHRVCYSLTVKDLLPTCYTCRSRNMGQIPFHENLRPLLVTRLWTFMGRTTKKGFILSEVHRKMGLSHQDFPITAKAISWMLQRNMLYLIERTDPNAYALRLNTLKINIDIDDVQYKRKPLKQGLYSFCFGPKVHNATNLRGVARESGRWKKFICEDTKRMCLIVDEDLDMLSWDSSPDVAFNSSSENSVDWNIGSQETSFSSQLQTERYRKRTMESDSIESIDNGTPDHPPNYLSSNPIPLSPRWKKAKNTVSGRYHYLSSIVD